MRDWIVMTGHVCTASRYPGGFTFYGPYTSEEAETVVEHIRTCENTREPDFIAFACSLLPHDVLQNAKAAAD